MPKSMRKSKNRYFYHIFVSPGNAPGAVMLNVVWMEREFDAYKLSCCMAACAHLSITVSEIERDICEKIVIFGRPLGQAYAIGNPSVRPSVCNVGGLWPNGLSDRDDFWHTPCGLPWTTVTMY